MPGSMPVRPRAVARDARRELPCAGRPGGDSLPRARSPHPRASAPSLRRRALLCEVLGDLPQIRVGQIGDEVIHRRVLALAVAKRDQLVVEIGGGLARDAREVSVAGALPALAVARDAALDARLHRIDRLEGWNGLILGQRRHHATRGKQCERTCRRRKTLRHHVEPGRADDLVWRRSRHQAAWMKPFFARVSPRGAHGVARKSAEMGPTARRGSERDR